MKEEKACQISQRTLNIIAKNLMTFINNQKDDHEWLSEVEEYLNDSEENTCSWNQDKVKIVLQILQIRGDDILANILTYLRQSEYGWQGSRYYFHNQCLRYQNHCRHEYRLSDDITLSEAYKAIHQLFQHEVYGRITSYLFGYSLAALFSSRLSHDGLRIPYFLQIACNRNSNMYKLIHEIVHICDVNAGINEHCCTSGRKGYGCTRDHITLFPASAGKSLEDMMYNRDVPVIVDGFENEMCYNALLRETASVPGKFKNLDIKSRFNTLPIFLCPTIKSQYRNVLSMDLTDFDVEDEYFELVHTHRRMLGAWAYELVMNAEEYTFSKLNDQEKKVYEATGQRDYFPVLNDYIKSKRVELRGDENLSETDVTNIAFISFFMKQYMKVIEGNIYMSGSVKASLGDRTPSDILLPQMKGIMRSIVAIHNMYSPIAPAAVTVNSVGDKSDKSSKVKKMGEKYAKDIVKYYQSYGVSIGLPEAEYVNDRYIFSVKLLPGTDGKLLNRYADEVRRLLEVETLYVDKTSFSIKLIVAEKRINENSLKKILDSKEFTESKMEIPYAVGYDIMGDMVIADIAKFPHLLIGGTSGYGKSSAVHSLLTSIVVKQPPEKVKLLLIDFGASRLKIFERTPHMLAPVIRSHEIDKGRQAILWLQNLMEERLKKKDALDERQHDSVLAGWPSIVCVIDEFPAFIQQLNSGRGNQQSHTVISDILSRARKVKIHLILTAQDATQENIAIKNTNLAAGIAFKCTNWHTSKSIIDDTIATELSGVGSMYFKCDQYEGLKRMQGAYLPPEEILDLLDDVNFDYAHTDRMYEDVDFQLNNPDSSSDFSEPENEEEQILFEIVKWLDEFDVKKLSNKNLKDKFGMGYDRAEVFMGLLESHEIIDAKRGKLPRNISRNKVKNFLGLSEDSQQENISPATTPSVISASENSSDSQLVDMKTLMEILQKQGVVKFQSIRNTEDMSETSGNDDTNSTKVIPHFDEILPDVILWVLTEEQVANSKMQEKFHIGNTRAKKMLDKMKELGLIKKLHGNLGWKVLHNKDSHDAAIQYLTSCGKTEEEVQEAISAFERKKEVVMIPVHRRY